MAIKKALKKTTPVIVLSDKEIVQEKYRFARTEKLKNRFCVFDKKDGNPVSGLAKSEKDAWKLAAHLVL